MVEKLTFLAGWPKGVVNDIVMEFSAWVISVIMYFVFSFLCVMS
jgi:hypothetical protein